MTEPVADLLGGLVRLLGQEDSLDVGEDSTLGDGDSGLTGLVMATKKITFRPF